VYERKLQVYLKTFGTDKLQNRLDISTFCFSQYTINAAPVGALIEVKFTFNPLTPELNPSAQRCLTRFFTGDFAS
jgi:hypothetical protein